MAPCLTDERAGFSICLLSGLLSFDHLLSSFFLPSLSSRSLVCAPQQQTHPTTQNSNSSHAQRGVCMAKHGLARPDLHLRLPWQSKQASSEDWAKCRPGTVGRWCKGSGMWRGLRRTHVPRRLLRVRPHATAPPSASIFQLDTGGGLLAAPLAIARHRRGRRRWSCRLVPGRQQQMSAWKTCKAQLLFRGGLSSLRFSSSSNDVDGIRSLTRVSAVSNQNATRRGDAFQTALPASPAGSERAALVATLAG
ncbi:hypothetical protein IWX90DRAFT_111970 [Phyllosticta citrichinensis]|uniref:Uncharacterized protein n=1 Tax=Phyllosticta citrichinensis TaxID=1130410 RepID=A0ABR1Y2W4_9PEZI